jgi:hypothetical protein
MENYLLEQAEAIILLATQQPNKYKEIAYSENFILPDEAHQLLSKRVNIYDMHISDDKPYIRIAFRVWFINEGNLQFSARYTLQISKLAPIFTDNFYMMLDTPIKDEFHLFTPWFDECISPTNEIDNFRNTLRAVFEKNGYTYAHHHNIYQQHYSFSRFLLPNQPNYHDTFCMANLLFENYFELYAQP